MKNKENKQEIENPETELSDDELDEASGGIIIVGGVNLTHSQAISKNNFNAKNLNFKAPNL